MTSSVSVFVLTFNVDEWDLPTIISEKAVKFAKTHPAIKVNHFTLDDDTAGTYTGPTYDAASKTVTIIANRLVYSQCANGGNEATIRPYCIVIDAKGKKHDIKVTTFYDGYSFKAKLSSYSSLPDFSDLRIKLFLATEDETKFRVHVEGKLVDDLYNYAVEINKVIVKNTIRKKDFQFPKRPQACNRGYYTGMVSSECETKMGGGWKALAIKKVAIVYYFSNYYVFKEFTFTPNASSPSGSLNVDDTVVFKDKSIDVPSVANGIVASSYN